MHSVAADAAPHRGYFAHVEPSRPLLHRLVCQSAPQCSYMVPYDGQVQALLVQHQARLVRTEAQVAWLTIQIEELFERMKAVAE